MITYALIGCGRISPNHIQAALQQKELQIVALCDKNLEKAQKLADTLPEEQQKRIKIYTNYQEMLEKQRPELCAIATESGEHAKIALDALDSGSNLIIEKPIALSLRDANTIIQRAEEKKLKVCACHQNRFNKSIQRVRKALERGAFSKLLHGTAHVRWCRNEQYYTQAPWRGTWQQDGGALMNQCIHNIDLLRWMMGDEIQEVTAYISKLNHPYIQAEDLGLALIKFKNGSYGLIEGTTNVYPANLEETLYLFGEKGTVKVGGESVNIIEEWHFAEEDDAETVKQEYSEQPENVYGFGHKALYQDMIEAINNDRQPYVDAKAGMHALELVLAIYKSAKIGGPVSLPLNDFSTLEMIDNFGD